MVLAQSKAIGPAAAAHPPPPNMAAGMQAHSQSIVLAIGGIVFVCSLVLLGLKLRQRRRTPSDTAVRKLDAPSTAIHAPATPILISCPA